MRLNKLALGLALSVLVATAVVYTPHVHEASAQALTYSPFAVGQAGASAVGTFIGVANAQDSILYDGELVCSDTTASTSSNVRRIGVRRFDGTALLRARIVGIVAGDIPKSSKRGTGRVLVWGYHPAAYVGLSNLGVNSAIKIGLLNAMFQGADTLEAACGVAISRTSASTSTVNTGPRYRYKVYFWGTRLAGATL